MDNVSITCKVKHSLGMNGRGIALFLVLSAFCHSATAADQSLTWTAGGTPATLGANNELVFTYDANDKVQTLAATIAAGDTITLFGDALDFATNAVLTLSGPGGFVISNALTGVNGLTVTNAQNAALVEYDGSQGGGALVTGTFKTVFPGCDLDDITLLYANNRLSGLSNPQICYPYLVRRMSAGGEKTMTAQMQICYYDKGYITKAAFLELRQSGADIEGRLQRTGCYAWVNSEGEDMWNLYQLWQSEPNTNVNTEVMRSGYSVYRLTAMWTGAPGVSLRGDLSGLGGALTVAQGASADILGAAAAAPASSISGQLIIGDADVSLNGTTGGDSNGMLVLAATRAGGCTVTLESGYLNRMAAKLGQVDRYRYLSQVDVCGRLIIKGDSAAGKTMTCKVKSWSAFPTNGVVEVRDGGVLDLTELANRGSPNNDRYQNDTATIRVYRGGVVRHYNNWTTLNEQKIELCGGAFSSSRTSGVTFSYQNNMLFEDGAILESGGATFWTGNTSDPSWKVRGTAPSYCNAPLQILGKSPRRVMALDVADVTGDDRPDFVFQGSISMYKNHENGGLNKLGIGTALLNGAFSLSNGVQVTCGTLVLGISDGWTGTGALTLAGGTFAVSNGTSNAINAPMKVTARGGTIHLGENATLSFADSSGETWGGAVTVSGFREDALRFGTPKTALTEAQESLLCTPGGEPLYIRSNGYITASKFKETLIIFK